MLPRLNPKGQDWDQTEAATGWTPGRRAEVASVDAGL